MDLKEMVQSVRDKADEAHSAFHAGHHDNARNYLGQIRTEIQLFLGDLEPFAGNVTESTSHESQEAHQSETPAQAAAAVLPATQFVDPAEAHKKALDEAGP